MDTEAQKRFEAVQREEVDAWKQKLLSDSSSADDLRAIASGANENNNPDKQQAALEMLEQEDPNWTSYYEQMEPVQLLHQLGELADGNLPSQSVFKILLDTLAKKGRLEWGNESVWLILNKLQKGTHFNPEEKALIEDKALRHQKIQKALAEIYSANEFRRLTELNEASVTRSKIETVTS